MSPTPSQAGARLVATSAHLVRPERRGRRADPYPLFSIHLLFSKRITSRAGFDPVEQETDKGRAGVHRWRENRSITGQDRRVSKGHSTRRKERCTAAADSARSGGFTLADQLSAMPSATSTGVIVTSAGSSLRIDCSPSEGGSTALTGPADAGPWPLLERRAPEPPCGPERGGLAHRSLPCAIRRLA